MLIRNASTYLLYHRPVIYRLACILGLRLHLYLKNKQAEP